MKTSRTSEESEQIYGWQLRKFFSFSFGRIILFAFYENFLLFTVLLLLQFVIQSVCDIFINKSSFKNSLFSFKCITKLKLKNINLQTEFMSKELNFSSQSSNCLIELSNFGSIK